MKTQTIRKKIKLMKDLRDNNIIDEEINDQLVELQRQIDGHCRVAKVKRQMTTQEHDEIMSEIEW